MQWTEALTYVGTFLGGSWLMNLYTARPKKNSIEIENMKTAMGELQKVINQLMTTNEAQMKVNEDFKRETDKTIKELKQRISDLSLKLDIKHEAIFACEHCEKVESTDDCIVMQTFKKRCKESLGCQSEAV